MALRKKLYMTTRSGKFFYPFKKFTDININDIAHALSLQCRFNGHCAWHYSIAQHCIYAARVARINGWSNAVEKWCLMHDAAEAYYGDIVSPVKYLIPKLMRAEKRLLKTIAQTFNLPWPIPKEIFQIDKQLLASELLALFPHSDEKMQDVKNVTAAPIMIFSWTPSQAHSLFLTYVQDLGIIKQTEGR
jgi:5'-deoxynucleotidase YfbR-like HD superfamily hydrolase